MSPKIDESSFRLILVRRDMSGDDPDSFQEFLRRCHEEDPDFGKVSNAKPHKEFAFAMVGSPSISSVAARDLNDASSVYHGITDYGVAVAAVPVGMTSTTIAFPFTDFGLRLVLDQGVVPVGAFLWHIARHVVAIAEQPSDFDIEDHQTKEHLLNLRFYRFYYSEDDEHWTVTFEPETASSEAGTP
jgi:hypothetical protein